MTALALVPIAAPDLPCTLSCGCAEIVASLDDRPAASAGWHESSHELRRGLQVIDLGDWLEAAVFARPSLRPFFALLPSAACV